MYFSTMIYIDNGIRYVSTLPGQIPFNYIYVYADGSEHDYGDGNFADFVNALSQTEDDDDEWPEIPF